MAATPITIATATIAITNIDDGAAAARGKSPEPPVHIRRPLLANPFAFTHNSHFNGFGGIHERRPVQGSCTRFVACHRAVVFIAADGGPGLHARAAAGL